MVMSNKSALGIIFPNIYDKLVPDLTSERLMASIPFGSRYRMIDFIFIQHGKLRHQQYFHSGP